jgi:hypothetical protein
MAGGSAVALNLRSLLSTDADDAPRTPEEALEKRDHAATPADPHVGWNAARTPPPDRITPDQQAILTDAVLDRIATPIDQLAGTVEILAEYLRQQRDREQKRYVGITITTIPVPVRNNGRPYNALIIGGVPTQTLTIQWPGQASYNKTLVAGWNILNVPDGAFVSVTTGNALDALWVTAYEFLGAPL